LGSGVRWGAWRGVWGPLGGPRRRFFPFPSSLPGVSVVRRFSVSRACGLRCRLGSSAVRVPASLSPMTGVEAEGLGRRTCTFRSSKRTDRRGGSATTAPACTISCNYGLQQERTRPDQDGQKRHSTRTFIAKDLRRTGALTSFPS
jgi:hypothetical protein